MALQTAFSLPQRTENQREKNSFFFSLSLAFATSNFFRPVITLSLQYFMAHSFSFAAAFSVLTFSWPSFFQVTSVCWSLATPKMSRLGARSPKKSTGPHQDPSKPRALPLYTVVSMYIHLYRLTRLDSGTKFFSL